MDKFKKISRVIFEKVIHYLLIIVFAVRILCYKETINDYVGLSSSILNNNFLTAISIIAIWFEYAATTMILLRTRYNFKAIKFFTKYITGIIFILNLALVVPICKLLCDGPNQRLLLIFYIIEAVLGLILSIYYFVKDFKIKFNWKEVLINLGIFLLLLIPALPNFFVQFMFGYGNEAYLAKEFTVYHRLLLYVGIIVPVILYFVLRNKSEEVIDFSLLYISLAVMLGFMFKYNYSNFLEPWTLPFHLCNTALFIVPLCLLFRMKKLFYFTYFINVLGAALAMLMPNYSDLTNILGMRIFQFWFNHWIAFFMPLLIVALKLFERPKLNQFFYSMVGFFGYYVLVLVLNVVFTAYGHTGVDFFFINSDYVADKLGLWAENLYAITATINANGHVFVFHPIYQFLYFIVYIFLGLGMWFVYAEFFRIADDHFKLHSKLRKIKLENYRYIVEMSDEERKQLEMEMSQLQACLELKNFSKKYATSKVYAVKDASFKIEAGEIFGFLGPNGAGKSTIIKSIVGIQPITDGAIEVCGLDVQHAAVKAKYNIGYVPDHYALYEKLTGREYVNYIADIYDVPKEVRDERIERYVKIFELSGSFDSKIKTYSHGMKQKITIMSALVHNPKVWILDEPLTGLDPNSIYQVKECMRQHAQEGNIVFFSSHLIDIVEKLCDRIAIIRKGQILCIKTVAEIEASGKSLEQFYLDTIEDNPEMTKAILKEEGSTVNE